MEAICIEDEKLVDYTMAGKRVRMARLGKGMAQEELANAAGLSVPYLSHIENAKSKASLQRSVRTKRSTPMTIIHHFALTRSAEMC